MSKQRGRFAPPPRAPGRIALAESIVAPHLEAIRTAKNALPLRVRLGDGRTLVCIRDGAIRRDYGCRDGMVVMASYDPCPPSNDLLLHISVSYKDHDPTWDDLKLLRAAFFADDTDVIQVLPRRGEYINLHQHCFHLFQAPEAWQGGWNV